MMSDKSRKLPALIKNIKSTYVISMFVLSGVIIALLVLIWILVGNPPVMALVLGIFGSLFLLVALLFNFFSTQRHFNQQGRIDSRLKLLDQKISKYQQLLVADVHRRSLDSANEQGHVIGERVTKHDAESHSEKSKDSTLKLVAASDPRVEILNTSSAKDATAKPVDSKVPVAKYAPASPVANAAPSATVTSVVSKAPVAKDATATSVVSKAPVAKDATAKPVVAKVPVAKAAPGSPVATPKTAVAKAAPGSTVKPVTPKAPLAKVSQVVPSKAGPSKTPDLDEALDVFHATPTAVALVALLARLWNDRGEITRPAALIHNHPQLVSEFNARGALLARQISDAANMQASLPPLPPRSAGPLVEPEADRVLYCVHATPEFHSNGYAIRTQGVAEGLVANGRKVRVLGRPGYPWDVIVPNKPERERILNDTGNVEYVYLPTAGLDQLPRGPYMQVAADAIVREALKFRPAVIQSASNSQTALPALIAARRLGIPFVYEVRGLWEVTQATKSEHWGASERYNLDADLETQVAVEADAVSVITRQLGEELVSRGVSEDKISVIPNAVDIKLIRPLLKDPVYKPAPGLGKAPLIGFAGSLVSYEGLDLLIDAVALLNAQGTDCRLVIAGSGNHELELQKAVKEKGLERLVHFLGRIPHEDVRRLLASLDVVVCPRSSNLVTEMVSPLKPLEAFAAGRVVLMSDVSPQRDLASKGEIAPLFKADDVESLKNVLRGLIEDDDLRRSYERRARLWVGDERTWKRVCARLLEAHTFAATSSTASLVSVPEKKLLPSIRLAKVGEGSLAVPFAEHCELVTIDSSPSRWTSILESTHFDAVIFTGRMDENGWDLTILKDFLQLASAQDIPSILVSDIGAAGTSVISDLARYTDHVIFSGTNEIDPLLALEATGETSLSVSTPIFDPQQSSPLGRQVRTKVFSALPEAMPSEQVLDLARVHGLLVCTTGETERSIPKRFAKHTELFEDSRKAFHRATETLAILRSSKSTDRNLTIEATARGLIEIVIDPKTKLDHLDDHLVTLMSDPEIWLNSAWGSVREAHRTSTAPMILTMLLRAAGVSVEYRRAFSYAVHLESVSESDTTKAIQDLLMQTVAPAAIVTNAVVVLSEDLSKLASRRGVQIGTELPESIDFEGMFIAGRARTFYEDLLTAARFEECDEVRVSTGSAKCGEIVSRAEGGGTLPIGLRRADWSRNDIERSVLVVHQATTVISSSESVDAGLSTVSISPMEKKFVEADGSTTRILIPGHDLKFITGISDALVAAGAEVEVDKWKNHTVHDEAFSLSALARAHVILCEWGLGNAIWYSNNKLPNQRLYVRVHSQEIKTSYLKNVNHDAVDTYIFVNELVRDIAVAFHGVPLEKTVIIPNGVDVEKLRQQKKPQAHKTIGFVGAVPQAKRLDIALDILEKVREIDPEYRMVVKGKGPEDYPWMLRRPAEMAWYKKQYDRIDLINESTPGTVILEGHGDDMAEWYSGIGVALSTSDFESFHFTIADGVASGARPAVLYWPGADGIYPRHWISNSIEQIANAIVDGTHDPADTALVEDQYSLETVSQDIQHLIAPGGERG